jgi:hypothetical protein
MELDLQSIVGLHAVLRIHDIKFGVDPDPDPSMPLNNGFGSGSFYFHH